MSLDEHIRERLAVIEAQGRDHARKLDEVRELARTTNGRVTDLEEILHGHAEERRRSAQPGLLARFSPVEKAHHDAQAVRRALWSAVTLLSSAFVIQLILIALSIFRGG